MKSFQEYILEKSESSTFVVRATEHPEEDLERNFSSTFPQDENRTRKEAMLSYAVDTSCSLEKLARGAVEDSYKEGKEEEVKKDMLNNLEVDVQKLIDKLNVSGIESVDDLFEDSFDTSKFFDNISCDLLDEDTLKRYLASYYVGEFPDFEYHPLYNGYVPVHYWGLGAYELDANNWKDAIEEAREKYGDYPEDLTLTMDSGDGHFFSNEVIDYKKASDRLYVFQLKG
jgi:hypothetical protein